MYKTIDKVITATELKKNLGHYMDYVMDSHQIVISKNGRPIVRLSPYIDEMERYWSAKEEAATYDYGNSRISYEEFLAITQGTETGKQYEFLNGEVIVMESPTKYHQEISGNLFVLFRSALKGSKCKVYYAPFDITLKKYDVKRKEWLKTPDVLQPDLVIACDTDEKTNERDRYMGVPSLVVEILSPGTRSRDMVDKLNTYMISGVREVWLVDPETQQIIQYCFEVYAIKAYRVYRSDEAVSSMAFEDMTFQLRDVFES